MLCVCDSVFSVICVNGERLRVLRRGVSCRGAWGLRPFTAYDDQASCGAGGAHFAIGPFGGCEGQTPAQMRSWWSERWTNTALPAPTHELAACVVAAPQLVCVAVGVATTDLVADCARRARL